MQVVLNQQPWHGNTELNIDLPEDWKGSVIKGIEPLAQSKGVAVDSEAFAMGWRLRKFQTLTQVKQGAVPRMNADQILRCTLDDSSSINFINTKVKKK